MKIFVFAIYYIYCITCIIHNTKLGFVRNMKIFFVQRFYSGFKVIETGIFLTKTSDCFQKCYGRHTDTSVSHKLKGLFTNWDI